MRSQGRQGQCGSAAAGVVALGRERLARRYGHRGLGGRELRKVLSAAGLMFQWLLGGELVSQTSVTVLGVLLVVALVMFASDEGGESDGE